MSLRPEICGFDLAAWRGLLGSGQDSAKASLRAALSEPAQAEALAIAIRAIDEGAPFTDVQVEGAHHVRAAIELANLVPQVATGSNVWKYGAFANLPPHLPPLQMSRIRSLGFSVAERALAAK